MAHFTLASIFTSKQPEFNCNVDQDGIFNLTRHVEKDSSPVYPFIKHGDHEAGFHKLIAKCHSEPSSSMFLSVIILLYITEGTNFDPLKYVKETLSRVGYVCEINFDPLARHYIF